MTHWQKYWNTAPNVVASGNYLRQVGKTVNGEPISQIAVDALVQDIIQRLAVQGTDHLLDLCCGNGLVTHQCASFCQSITGVDYSEPLLQIATTHFGAPNIRYRQANAFNLPDELLRSAFDKIYMYEAVQHFEPAQLKQLLSHLRQSASGYAPVLLASVPDDDRLWSFYNTAEREAEYHRRKAEGTEAIGHWWTRSELARIADQCGYRVDFHMQNSALHTAHYRFDALLQPAHEPPTS